MRSLRCCFAGLSLLLVAACNSLAPDETLVASFNGDKTPAVATPAPLVSAAEPISMKADPITAARKEALSLASVGDPKSQSYKIGPLDVLEITVFKVAELSKTVQVSEAGTFAYPLLGEVDARDRTARDVEALLTKQLGAKFLQNPQVIVLVKEQNSQRVTIEGAVKKPGVFPLSGGLSLMQVIAQAEGFDATAQETAVILRLSHGKRAAAKFDIADIRAGRLQDPKLQPGDVIVAPTSDVKQGMSTFTKFLPLTPLFALL